MFGISLWVSAITAFERASLNGPLDHDRVLLELNGQAVVRAAAGVPHAVGKLLRSDADLPGGCIAHAIWDRNGSVRDVDLGVGNADVEPVAAAGVERMVALMGVNVERKFSAAAHVLPLSGPSIGQLKVG